MSTERAARVPVYSIALLSAAALAYEVLLLRLFSIIQWHHYAYMIISLALLGYGASGTFIALLRRRLLRRFDAVFVACPLLFGLASFGCFVGAQRIHFHPEEVLFAPAQWLHLTAIYLLLSLPFFFVATAIGLALARFRDRVARVYAADLLGAGTGSVVVVALLFALFPASTLKLISALGIVAALVASLEIGLRPRVATLLLAALVAAPLAVADAWSGLLMSPYKDLSQTLRIAGARVLEQRSSPLGLITVVDNRTVPLRHAPGMSLHAVAEPPPQLGLFVDGNGPSAINRATGDIASLAYLDQLTSALPFHMDRPDSVLVLGAGGGTAVLQALQLGARQVDAVELNPQIVSLVADRYAEFSGGLYRDPRVRVATAEARDFLRTTTRRFDLVQLPIPDSFGAASAGLHALREDYLFTVEAVRAYLRHLAPNGYLAINRWVMMPPRDTLKALATVATALEREGITDADQRLVLIRGWQTSTLVVKNGVLSASELAAVRAFCRQRSFDLAYAPGMTASEANRYNLLREPYFFKGARALLGERRQAFLDGYKFELRPATDERPYFFHFFRWRTLPELLSLFGQGGAALLDTGYLVLVATLAQALAASTVLILLPLLLLRRSRERRDGRPGRARVLIYFAALGLGFLFVEIAFIQKLILFLHHPVYAVAVALAAFLLFAGLGSAWSQPRDPGRASAGPTQPMPGVAGYVTVLILLVLGYAFGLERIFEQLASLPGWARAGVAMALIAPLGFCMGVPFPRGLTALGARAPELMPWAWGINGCASVISSVAATLIAIHFGFTVLLAVACALYLLAALSFPRPAVA